MEPRDFVVVSHPVLVEAPEDPEAYWDLTVVVDDTVADSLFNDLLQECADYIAHLPGVDDVPHDGGEMIPVCGSIRADALRQAVRAWWIAMLRGREAEPDRLA
jgi:hypothetical protein